MRHEQHELRVVIAAGAILGLLSGAPVALAAALSSDPTPGGAPASPALPPPVVGQVPSTSGGRAALPSTRVGMPRGMSGLGGRPQPLGKSSTQQPAPAVRPIQGTQPVDIPIGRPSDPERVFRERREFDAGLRSRTSDVAGASAGSPGLSVSSAGGVSGSVSAGSGSSRLHGVVSLNSGSLTSSLMNSGDRWPGSVGLNDPNGVSLQYGAWGGPYGQPYWYPYYYGSERRIINPANFSQYDPALSRYYDPQAMQREAEAQQQAPAVAPSALERGAAALVSRHYPSAIKALRQAIKESPENRVAERALGVAELMSGNMVDGVSSISRAYLAEPGLADQAFTGAELGLTDADLRELSTRVVGYANRTPTVASLVTAAVLLQGRERDDAAVSMIERAGKAGLNSDLVGELSRAIKPASSGAVVSPVKANTVKKPTKPQAAPKVVPPADDQPVAPGAGTPEK